MIKIIGFIAAVLTSISFLPQVWKTLKTKSTKDISLSTFLIGFVGTSLWLVYGFVRKKQKNTILL